MVSIIGKIVCFLFISLKLGKFVYQYLDNSVYVLRFNHWIWFSVYSTYLYLGLSLKCYQCTDKNECGCYESGTQYGKEVECPVGYESCVKTELGKIV